MLTLKIPEFTINMTKINSLLIPNISSLPSDAKTDKKAKGVGTGDKSEFKSLIDKELFRTQQVNGQSEQKLNVSSHAVRRLQERNIEFDSNEYIKLKEAINKLRAKGGHDSLVITDRAAYVIDVDKNTVVTAVDKNRMNENVFTKIDSTIFMN
jgi:flagellar operon protein